MSAPATTLTPNTVALMSTKDTPAPATLADTGFILADTDGEVVPPGYVGEVLSVTTTVSSGQVAFATSTTHNVLSLTLTPGNWFAWGNAVLHSAGGAAVPTDAQMGLSLVSGALPIASLQAADVYGVALATDIAEVLPPQMFNVSVNTTIYVVAHVDLTSGTDIVAYGAILARRIR